MHPNSAPRRPRAWRLKAWRPTLVAIAALLAPMAAPRPARAEGDPVPQWIWLGEPANNQTVYFRYTIELPEAPKRARLVAVADNTFEALVNQKEVLAGADWNQPSCSMIEKQLVKGKNVLAFDVVNTDGPGAFAALLEVEFADGKKVTFATGPDWRANRLRLKDWEDIDHNDSKWAPARVIGAVGAAGLPWSGAVTLPALRQAQPAGPDAKPHEDDKIRHAAGFKVERIYSVPKLEQGSWISMAMDPKGRFIVSDQEDAGFFRVTPPTVGEPDAETKVEKMPINIGGAHGLVWAFDSLYADANGKTSGLHRLRDTNGDDQLDKDELLRPLLGGGEHGPHAVIVSPDGKSLYVHCGNHTDLTPLAGSLIPSNWSEDMILPRQWDANGHAKGRMAPGGWVARTDPEGKDWTIISVGYRNQYDMGVNRFGDLFVYDSDMEWDMGMPWYVPTRLCHATSGSSFGWRSGSGRFPAYYEDSLPPVIDIGPGSPTGVVSGAGAKFPTRYQDAMFILDWTFGTIWAIHLKPKGSSYTATKEEFVSGSPLPVTDAVVGQDGLLYFTVGGRGTQSALYRVRYEGGESLAAPTADDPVAHKARDLRHSLETFHGRKDPAAVEAAWPHMGSDDIFIRHAARLAVEAQPVAEWRDRALAEKAPMAAANAFIALAHQGAPELKGRALEAISKFDLGKLDAQTLLAMLRAYELIIIRLGDPDAAETARAIAQIDPVLPGKDDNANAEAASLLVRLKAPSAVEKCLALMSDPRPQTLPDWAEVIKRNPNYGSPIRAMLNNPPPTRGIHYAFILRNLRYGWSMPQREAYFKFIVEASKKPGGSSYVGFLKNTRTEALANCSEAERVALASITGESLDPPAPFEVKPVKGPGRQWTLDEAAKTVGAAPTGRSFEAGRNAFHSIGCIKCHRFDGAGGAIGPDVTTARNKFSPRDLLEAMVEPSKVISDQYASSNVTLKSGQVVSGLAIPVTPGDPNSDVEIHTSNADEPPVKAKRSEIESIEPSKVSQMPESLLDPLSPDELRDLVAYVLSQGDPNDPMFKK